MLNVFEKLIELAGDVALTLVEKVRISVCGCPDIRVTQRAACDDELHPLREVPKWTWTATSNPPAANEPSMAPASTRTGGRTLGMLTTSTRSSPATPMKSSSPSPQRRVAGSDPPVGCAVAMSYANASASGWS